MPFRFPRGDTEKAIGYTNLEFKGTVWAGEVNLGVFSERTIYKALGLDENN